MQKLAFYLKNFRDNPAKKDKFTFNLLFRSE